MFGNLSSPQFGMKSMPTPKPNLGGSNMPNKLGPKMGSGSMGGSNMPNKIGSMGGKMMPMKGGM